MSAKPPARRWKPGSRRLLTTRLSTVIVAYRSTDSLSGLLPTLVEVADEVVVVNNDPGDERLPQVLDGMQRVKLLPEPRNLGFAAGANAGVSASSGDLILLMNPDMRVTVADLETLLKAAARHGEAILGPTVLSPDGDLLKTRSGSPLSLLNLLGEQLLIPESAPPGRFPAKLWTRWRSYEREEPGGLLSGCCLLFPRSVWEAVGPFDERYFLYWEDVDWQLRAEALGIRTWLIPGAIVVHSRSSSTSLYDPHRARLFYESYKRFLSKWATRPMSATVLVVVFIGQLVRWAVWTLSIPFKPRVSATRRSFHKKALATLVRRSPPRESNGRSIPSERHR